MKLHIYKAVIIFHERMVKAPSALAAAVFSGKHADKSAKSYHTMKKRISDIPKSDRPRKNKFIAK
ncbi:MAG: hypothetical protein KAU60_08995 [Desulfobacterales bacterium]|nr:hypothetical protein [Desulfobacterales bacterium]